MKKMLSVDDLARDERFNRIQIEETVFDRFRINAKIDPGKFEARK